MEKKTKLLDRQLQVNLVEAAFMQAAIMKSSVGDACLHHHEEIQNNAGLPKKYWSDTGDKLGSRMCYMIRQNPDKLAGWIKSYGVNYRIVGPHKQYLPQYKRKKELSSLDKAQEFLILEANAASKAGELRDKQVLTDMVKNLERQLGLLTDRVASLEQAYVKGGR